MAVRLRQLTAPFHTEDHQLIQSSLYPLHLTVRPHLASTSCPTAADYLTTLETLCALSQSTLILASLPDSADDAVVGFALYRSVHDTFNTHRLAMDELVVHPTERRKGVGGLLLQYVQQTARDVGALYVTAEVPAGWTECQPLLGRHRFGLAALSFSTTSTAPATRTAPALLSPTSPAGPSSATPAPELTDGAIATTVINVANFSTPASTRLLTALEPIYRQLRPSTAQLPATTAAYLERLHSIYSLGACSIVAHTPPTAPFIVYGVATCRHLHTLAHGRRLHVDDLVTDSALRSHGVGKWLVGAVRRMAAEEEQGGGEGKEGREGGLKEGGRVAVTLESGTHRQAAHRFYWREGFVSRELYWRWQVEPAPQEAVDRRELTAAGTSSNTVDAAQTVTVS